MEKNNNIKLIYELVEEVHSLKNILVENINLSSNNNPVEYVQDLKSCINVIKSRKNKFIEQNKENQQVNC
jgi:hypothetical protein